MVISFMLCFRIAGDEGSPTAQTGQQPKPHWSFAERVGPKTQRDFRKTPGSSLRAEKVLPSS